MKNEGFTLVELLAVLLILAFIALIAVPQILNLIEDSKIRSLKLSTESYIRAVNTSLINEEVFNNVKDGLYTITDDGKKIVLGDKEIYIASEGHRLKSGLLLIEDSKVKRVLKGMIDDYYARVNGEEITILKNLNESTLVSGTTFNTKIKQLVGDEGTNGADPNSGTVDTTVKKITFLQDSVLPEGYTKEQLQLLKSTDLSSKNDESIKGYYDDKTGVIYVYSDGYISCPTNLKYFFESFQGVEEIELNLIDTSKVTNMGAMFRTCNSLKNINLFGLDTSKVTDMSEIFRGCNSLEEVDLSDISTKSLNNIGGQYGSSMFNGCINLKEIKFGKNFDTSRVDSMIMMFNGCSSLEKLDLSMFDTSNVTSMASMFQGCTKLKKIKGLENFDTRNVTDMGIAWSAGMFGNCSSLEELDLRSFNTSQVKIMAMMFRDCSNLKEIKGLEKFDTSNVTSMFYMFAGCKNLMSLDLSNFKTSSVTSMERMFMGCTNLEEIMFGEDCTFEKVSEFNQMFQSCTSLTKLDLSSFNISNATTLGNMFSGCTNLNVIKVKGNKWDDLKSTSGFRGEFTYVEDI